MTFVPADPIVSGRPYSVLDVDDASPSNLDQFIGAAAFTIDRDGSPSKVCGEGAAGEAGVLFREKDVHNSGKDVRVWLISKSDRGFTAEPVPRF